MYKRQGFSFSESQRLLPETRKQSFNSLVTDIASHLLASKTDQQEFVFEGSWEEIQHAAGLLFGDGSTRVTKFLNGFRERELSGSGKRSLLSIENELVQAPESLHLYLWTVPEAEVIEHLPLFGQNPYLYSEIEHELSSGIWSESFRMLFQELLFNTFDFIAPVDSKLGLTIKNKNDLFALIKGGEIPGILKNAAYLAHERASQSGRWKREVFMRRRVR